jgi:hypothetical protein
MTLNQGVESMFTQIAERRMVVRFDFRGFGMSEPWAALIVGGTWLTA